MTVPSEPEQAPLSKTTIWVMAISVGVIVANIYYVQPLLPSIKTTFHLSSAVAGLLVTTSQVGYVLGLALIVPLGDLLERRRLICTLSLLTAASLAVSERQHSLRPVVMKWSR